MTPTPRINPFTDILFSLAFFTSSVNAIWGEPLWQHVASLLTTRPGVAELLHGTSGLLLLGLFFWRGMRLKGRITAKVQ